MKEDSVYAETAYRSDRPIIQTEPVEGFIAGKYLRAILNTGFVNKLSFDSIEGAIAVNMLILDKMPNKAKSLVHGGSTLTMDWSEETLRLTKGDLWTSIFMMFSFYSKIACLLITPILWLTSCFILVNHIAEGYKNALESTLSIPIIFGGPILFCALVWLFRDILEAKNISLWFFKQHRMCDLDRRTGLITVYHKNRELYRRPFVEFDCYLSRNMIPKSGVVYYDLHLRHRYEPQKVNICLTLIFGNWTYEKNVTWLWYMLLQYMDVTKPLPDIIMLEECRANDPTTRAFDELHQRNPRYWRDMSDCDYLDKLYQIENEQLQGKYYDCLINDPLWKRSVE